MREEIEVIIVEETDMMIIEGEAIIIKHLRFSFKGIRRRELRLGIRSLGKGRITRRVLL
jgi:hypothetical protein